MNDNLTDRRCVACGDWIAQEVHTLRKFCDACRKEKHQATTGYVDGSIRTLVWGCAG